MKKETKKKETNKIEMTVNGPIKTSPTREKFAALIERYKLQNPVKYEHKKAALEKKLESL